MTFLTVDFGSALKFVIGVSRVVGVDFYEALDGKELWAEADVVVAQFLTHMAYVIITIYNI